MAACNTFLLGKESSCEFSQQRLADATLAVWPTNGPADGKIIWSQRHEARQAVSFQRPSEDESHLKVQCEFSQISKLLIRQMIQHVPCFFLVGVDQDGAAPDRRSSENDVSWVRRVCLVPVRIRNRNPLGGVRQAFPGLGPTNVPFRVLAAARQANFRKLKAVRYGLTAGLGDFC